MSPEVQARIQYLRQESLHRELTLDELREALEVIAQGRVQSAVTKKTQKAKAVVNTDDLLAELDGI
jgi:hypothetical protein